MPERILARNFIASSLAVPTSIDPIGAPSLSGASLSRYQDFPFSSARGMSSDIAQPAAIWKQPVRY